MIASILGEAKRILAEVGLEIRGAGLRQRLLDHGLKTLRPRRAAARRNRRQ
jgi:hypothetical protein